MADKNQASRTSETKITVDMNAAEPEKSVTRRTSNDIAEGVRDGADTDQPVARTRAEKDLFKRMGRLERSLEKQFDQRMATREAEHQRQISELQAKLDKVSLERGGDDKADAAHESAMNALKEKLAAAYEKGDSAASADITRQMSTLDAQFWAKKANAAGVTSRAAAADQGTQPTQQAQPKVTRPTIAGTRFINANEDWWEDPEFLMEQAAANAIFIELRDKEGFDAKDGEMYKEIAKRLKAKFPRLPVKAGAKDPDEDEDEDAHADADRGQTRQRRQAASARIDDRGDPGSMNRANSTSRTLTAQEIETMKACRLDPESDRDVVQFLRESIALEAAGS